MDIHTIGSRILESVKKLESQPEEAVNELKGEIDEVSSHLNSGQQVTNEKEANNIDKAIQILTSKDSQEKISALIAPLTAKEIMEPYVQKLRDLSDFLKRGERVEKTDESTPS